MNFWSSKQKSINMIWSSKEDKNKIQFLYKNFKKDLIIIILEKIIFNKQEITDSIKSFL